MWPIPYDTPSKKAKAFVVCEAGKPVAAIWTISRENAVKIAKRHFGNFTLTEVTQIS